MGRQQVAYIGLESCVSAKNNHHIRGRGIPAQRMHENFGAANIADQLIPTTDEAIQLYREAGGQLTMPSHTAGVDPLAEILDLQI